MSLTIGNCRKNCTRRIAQHQAQEAATGRQERALGDQLPDDATATAANGETQGDLALPRRPAAHEETGNVGTGDEQHDERQRQQHEGARRRRSPLFEACIEVRSHEKAVAAIRIGVRRLQACGDERHLFTSLCERDIGLETAFHR